MSAPKWSKASAISSALIEGVPLKSMCSRKWDSPCSAGASSLDPVSIQTPSDTDRTSARRSVSTFTPDWSSVLS